MNQKIANTNRRGVVPKVAPKQPEKTVTVLSREIQNKKALVDMRVKSIDSFKTRLKGRDRVVFENTVKDLNKRIDSLVAEIAAMKKAQ